MSTAPSSYLEKHGVPDFFFTKMSEALLNAAPEDPWDFMIDYINAEKKKKKTTGSAVPMEERKGANISTEKKGGTGGKAPAAEDEEEGISVDAQAAAAAQSRFHDHLSLEQRALVVDSFLAIDANRDGSIDVSEMRALLGDEGEDALTELNEVWDEVKSGGNVTASSTPGKLHLFQFLAVMNHLAKDSQKFVEALKGFIAEAAKKKTTQADDSDDKLFADADRDERWLLTELFLAFDSNRDGVLDRAECRLFEKLAKLPSSEAEAEKKSVFSLTDITKNEPIHFQEFLNKGLKDLQTLPDRSGARQAAVARLHALLTTLKTGKQPEAKKQPAAALPDDSQLGRWINKMKDVVFSNERDDHYRDYASSPIPAAVLRGDMPALHKNNLFAAHPSNAASQKEVANFESDLAELPPSCKTLIRFDDAQEQTVFRNVFGPDAKVMIALFQNGVFVVFKTPPKNIDECPEGTTLYGSFGVRINNNIDTVVPVLLAMAAGSTVTRRAPWWPKQKPKVSGKTERALSAAANVELNEGTVTVHGVSMRLPKLITDGKIAKPNNQFFVHSTASPHEDYEDFKMSLVDRVNIDPLDFVIDHRIAEHQQEVAKFLGRDLQGGKVFIGCGPGGLVVCGVTDLPPPAANSATGGAGGGATVNGVLCFVGLDDTDAAIPVVLALLKTIEIEA